MLNIDCLNCLIMWMILPYYIIILQHYMLIHVICHNHILYIRNFSILGRYFVFIWYYLFFFFYNGTGISGYAVVLKIMKHRDQNTVKLITCGCKSFGLWGPFLKEKTLRYGLKLVRLTTCKLRQYSSGSKLRLWRRCKFGF